MIIKLIISMIWYNSVDHYCIISSAEIVLFRIMLGQQTTYILFLMRLSFEWYIWNLISIKNLWDLEFTTMNLILTIKSQLFPLNYIDVLPENNGAGNRPLTHVFSPHINLSTSKCWCSVGLSHRCSSAVFPHSFPINHLMPVALSMIYTLTVFWFLSPALAFLLNTELRYPTTYSVSSLGCQPNLKCTKQNWFLSLALTCSSSGLSCLRKWFHEPSWPGQRLSSHLGVSLSHPSFSIHPQSPLWLSLHNMPHIWPPPTTSTVVLVKATITISWWLLTISLDPLIVYFSQSHRVNYIVSLPFIQIFKVSSLTENALQTAYSKAPRQFDSSLLSSPTNLFPLTPAIQVFGLLLANVKFILSLRVLGQFCSSAWYIFPLELGMVSLSTLFKSALMLPPERDLPQQRSLKHHSYHH